MPGDVLKWHYDQLHRDATRLAGGLTDLAQRATVYRHLFLASGGNHAFPLIAAHGALWAGGYFRWGLRLGAALSWQCAARPAWQRHQLERLHAFANVFRDINRRVCIDTYVNFHFTRRFGRHSRATEFIPADLLEPLNRLHAAERTGQNMCEQEKQFVFESHFRNEQRTIVGPTLTQAVAEFDWPLVRAIALRPPVRFAYFPGWKRLWFRDFSSQDERVEKGLAAFTLASRAGWSIVDATLQTYRVLPTAFFTTPAEYFDELRAAVLAAA